MTAAELLTQGRQQYQSGQYSAASNSLKQAILLSDNEPLLKATALSNLALAEKQTGNWTTAQSAVDNAKKLLVNLEPDPTIIRVLAQIWNTQGTIYLEQGKFDFSLDAFRQEEKLYASLPSSQDRKKSLIRNQINQIKALQSLGLFQSVKEKLEDLEEDLIQETDYYFAAEALRNLGNTQATIGRLADAEESLKLSLERATTTKSSLQIGKSRLSLGRVRHAMWKSGNSGNEKELPGLEALVEKDYLAVISRELPEPIRVKGLVNLLLFCFDTTICIKNPQDIQAEITEILPHLALSRFSINTQIQFAELLYELPVEQLYDSQNIKSKESQQQKVIYWLRKALVQARQLEDQRSESYALGILGQIYQEAGQTKKAKQLFQRAIDLGKLSDSDDITYKWQWKQGQTLKQEGNIPQAIEAYEGAIATLKNMRGDIAILDPETRFNFSQSIEPIYRETVSLTLQSIDSSDSEEEEQIHLKRAKELIESLQVTELVDFFQADCIAESQIIIDEKLENNEVLIYPILVDDRMEILLSRKDENIVRKTVYLNAKDINDIAKQFQNALSHPDNRKQAARGNGITQSTWEVPDFLPLAQELYSVLIEPVEETLNATGTETIIFVLDGTLRNIPMAALHDGEKYLVENYAVVISPSLKLLNPEPLASKDIQAVVGALSEGRFEFPPIPAVEAEVEQIKQQVDSEVLLNQNFLDENLERTVGTVPFPIVHLATHGQFSSRREDTFLLAWNRKIGIEQLTELLRDSELERGVPIELLILSACETAKGDTRAALGLAGIAVQAGARSTIASLWKVNDVATSVLMGQLYEELGNKGISRASALQKAQLELLYEPTGRYAHPYFWSPFVLVGNWL
ncbi:CHAT domain-containing protein [[Leptolyngbya] sp. PCC 7376]|uniref:CHAT domain-containing protein n=1 Tax=[Leptolyngbya] sp. PCC 7376 TaxID=111781 RepID=UPI001359AE5E|nr:CHAT domain-containing protein [[Leptolyngbya] sp. PCC 7376]